MEKNRVYDEKCSKKERTNKKMRKKITPSVHKDFLWMIETWRFSFFMLFDFPNEYVFLQKEILCFFSILKYLL